MEGQGRRSTGNGRSTHPTRLRSKALKPTLRATARRKRRVAGASRLPPLRPRPGIRMVRSGGPPRWTRASRSGREPPDSRFGDGSGDEGTARGQLNAVTRKGCGRGEFFEGSCVAGKGRAGSRGLADHGNAANPRVGSGMQQARDCRAEKPVEVVQNHEDGTGSPSWLRGAEGESKDEPGVDARQPVDGGETRDEPQERRSQAGIFRFAEARSGTKRALRRGGRAESVTMDGGEGQRPAGLSTVGITASFFGTTRSDTATVSPTPRKLPVGSSDSTESARISTL
jgi:hypothetical protein